MSILTNREIAVIRALIKEALSKYEEDQQEDIFITPAECKRLLNVSDTTLWKLRCNPDSGIEFTKHGRVILYKRSSVINYLNQNVVK